MKIEDCEKINGLMAERSDLKHMIGRLEDFSRNQKIGLLKEEHRGAGTPFEEMYFEGEMKENILNFIINEYARDLKIVNNIIDKI